jgi:hypothetical protein
MLLMKPVPLSCELQDADGTYKRKISQMMDRKERRLIVDMGDVRRYMPKLADRSVYIIQSLSVLALSWQSSFPFDVRTSREQFVQTPWRSAAAV